MLKFKFFKIISGLADEVSGGSLNTTTQRIQQLLEVCFPMNEKIDDEKLLDFFLDRIVSNLDSMEPKLREEV